MLTAEIKINGCLIGHLYITNISNHFDNYGDNSYRWEYYCVHAQDGEPSIQIGNLSHKRAEGAIELIRKVTSVISEKKKNGERSKKTRNR